MKKNPNIGSTVFVIDDDASLRAALKELFSRSGCRLSFGSGESFLERKHSNSTSCLVLDIRLPG